MKVVSSFPSPIISSNCLPIFLDVGLAAFDGQPLFHQRTDREFVGHAAIDAGDRQAAALAAGRGSPGAAPSAGRCRGRCGPWPCRSRLSIARPWLSMPTAVDARVGADAAGHFEQAPREHRPREIEHLGAHRLGQFQPARIMVDRDHPMRAEHERRLDREQPDRPAAPDRDRIARLDLGIDRRHASRSAECRTGTAPCRPRARRE